MVNREEHDGHGATPQVRGGSLPHRRGGLFPHPDGGGPVTNITGTRSWARRSSRYPTLPTPPAFVPRRAPTGKTRGGLSASTSSIRWNWSSSRSRRTPTGVGKADPERRGGPEEAEDPYRVVSLCTPISVFPPRRPTISRLGSRGRMPTGRSPRAAISKSSRRAARRYGSAARRAQGGIRPPP